MKNHLLARFILVLLCINTNLGTRACAGDVVAQPRSAPPSEIHYKSGKDVNFEDLLIQGALKRPDLIVVTGDSGQGGDSLLRLRENFLDRVSEDAGDEIQ